MATSIYVCLLYVCMATIYLSTICLYGYYMSIWLLYVSKAYYMCVWLLYVAPLIITQESNVVFIKWKMFIFVPGLMIWLSTRSNVFTLNSRTPWLLTTLFSKSEEDHFSTCWWEQNCWMANSVYPDQTPHFAASDLGLHCLLKPVCPNIEDKYGNRSLCNNMITCCFLANLFQLRRPASTISYN